MQGGLINKFGVIKFKLRVPQGQVEGHMEHGLRLELVRENMVGDVLI